MILSILTLIPGIIWLLYETEWLRVRLPIGKAAEQPQGRYVSWNDIENQIQYLPDRFKPFWIKHRVIIKTIRGLNHQILGAAMQPLCGWDWLLNREHIIPEYKIELALDGIHYQMNVKSDSILAEVMRVNRAKHKPTTPKPMTRKEHWALNYQMQDMHKEPIKA